MPVPVSMKFMGTHVKLAVASPWPLSFDLGFGSNTTFFSFGREGIHNMILSKYAKNTLK